MRSAVIAPTALLEEYGSLGDAYHLVLNHTLLTDEKYADFYRKRQALGDFVILDNSAHEFGEGSSIKDLERGIKLLKPSEVVLPDRLFFGDDTIEASREAYYVLRDKYPMLQLMGVPQGRTHAEWRDCLEALIHLGVDTIGVSKDYETWPGGLNALVRNTIDTARRSSRNIDIHMLGWGRNLWELSFIAKNYGPAIRGVDSAKPLVYAGHGIELPLHLTVQNTPAYPRRNGFFKTASVDDLLARKNIHVFKSQASGK